MHLYNASVSFASASSPTLAWYIEDHNLHQNMDINNTLNSNMTMKYAQFAATAQFVTGTIFYPFICVLGIICNCLCLTVFRRPAMQSSTNAYLTALALGDLVKLTNDLVYFPAVLLKYFKTGRHLYTVYYPGGYFLSQYLSTVTAWITVLVTFERFLMIVYPRRVHGRLNSKRARSQCIIMYIIMLFLTLPCAFRYRAICRSNESDSLWPGGCKDNSTIHLIPNAMWSRHNLRLAFSAIQGCVQSLIPLCLLVLLNLRIITVLYAPRANKRLLARHHLTRMLFVIVAAFILLTTPDAIISVLGWGYHEETTGLIKGIREITDTLLAFNSDIHFFIYVSFNRKFRDHLMNLAPYCGRPLPTGQNNIDMPTALLQKKPSEKNYHKNITEGIINKCEEQVPLRQTVKQDETIV